MSPTTLIIWFHKRRYQYWHTLISMMRGHLKTSLVAILSHIICEILQFQSNEYCQTQNFLKLDRWWMVPSILVIFLAYLEHIFDIYGHNLGISFAYIDNFLGIFWAYLGHLFGISWAYLEHILSISSKCLGHSWAYLRNISCLSYACFGIIGGIFQAYLEIVFSISWAYIRLIRVKESFPTLLLGFILYLK